MKKKTKRTRKTRYYIDIHIDYVKHVISEVLHICYLFIAYTKSINMAEVCFDASGRRQCPRPSWPSTPFPHDQISPLKVTAKVNLHWNRVFAGKQRSWEMEPVPIETQASCHPTPAFWGKWLPPFQEPWKWLHWRLKRFRPTQAHMLKATPQTLTLKSQTQFFRNLKNQLQNPRPGLLSAAHLMVEHSQSIHLWILEYQVSSYWNLQSWIEAKEIPFWLQSLACLMPLSVKTNSFGTQK